MKPGESTVRVWVGLDPLQAEMMKQMLLENGIECFHDRSVEVLPLGSMGEIGLWVSKENEARARELLTALEDEMSEALDTETDEEEDSGE
ncbi:MAG TPA: DUF2007 domain-containing protein [Candidatus Acidoferrales bacterium]|nr:DUF2007 domain-containing protein [Candidatus Acidoferrales bacterium]